MSGRGEEILRLIKAWIPLRCATHAAAPLVFSIPLDTTNMLKVHGNAGDLLTVLDNGWVDGWSHGFYHSYIQGDAMLLVGQNLTANFV